MRVIAAAKLVIVGSSPHTFFGLVESIGRRFSLEEEVQELAIEGISRLLEHLVARLDRHNHRNTRVMQDLPEFA